MTQPTSSLSTNPNPLAIQSSTADQTTQKQQVDPTPKVNSSNSMTSESKFSPDGLTQTVSASKGYDDARTKLDLEPKPWFSYPTETAETGVRYPSTFVDKNATYTTPNQRAFENSMKQVDTLMAAGDRPKAEALLKATLSNIVQYDSQQERTVSSYDYATTYPMREAIAAKAEQHQMGGKDRAGFSSTIIFSRFDLNDSTLFPQFDPSVSNEDYATYLMCAAKGKFYIVDDEAKSAVKAQEKSGVKFDKKKDKVQVPNPFDWSKQETLSHKFSTFDIDVPGDMLIQPRREALNGLVEDKINTMQALDQLLTDHSVAPEVLLHRGPLGAGKTTLVRDKLVELLNLCDLRGETAVDQYLLAVNDSDGFRAVVRGLSPELNYGNSLNDFVFHHEAAHVRQKVSKVSAKLDHVIEDSANTSAKFLRFSTDTGRGDKPVGLKDLYVPVETLSARNDERLANGVGVTPEVFAEYVQGAQNDRKEFITAALEGKISKYYLVDNSTPDRTPILTIEKGQVTLHDRNLLIEATTEYPQDKDNRASLKKGDVDMEIVGKVDASVSEDAAVSKKNES